MTKYISLLILGILIPYADGFAQGAFLFQNYYPLYGVNLDAPVFNSDGLPLYGTEYLASLYGGSTQDSLVEAVDANSGHPLRVPFTFTPNGDQGYFTASSTYAIVPSVAPGNVVYLQVRAWDARLGNSYEEAFARGLGGYGASLIFSEIAPVSTSPPSPLHGLHSFSLVAVPEPATWVLMGAGLVVLWAGCKRRI